MFHAFLLSANFFFKINSQNSMSVKQIGSRSRPMFLLGLIWVQTICESYQQMALGDKKLPFTMLNLNISYFVNRVNPEQSYSEKTADKDTHCISLCLQIQANYWNLAG